jgi:uncharacterized protein with HEPN domain
MPALWSTSAISWNVSGASRYIITFRNVLVHDYLGIDLERIWEIIQRDVPTFKRAILLMLGQKS